MRRNAALAAAALAGAAAGALLARARRPPALSGPLPEEPDPRAADLRRKLAEARTASEQEDEFEAAGMGAETIVSEAGSPPRPAPPGRAPVDEFEAMRRRIHEEGRAAADEMRRGSEPPPTP